jgi:beta-lactamase regulating signal transducer with metallopeptidase domain
MRYYVLFLLVTCASYAAASLAAAAVAALAWPTVRQRARRLAPGARARVLAAWRLLPAAAGGAWTLVLAGAFARYEPRDTTEVPGMLLLAAAGSTLLLGAHALARFARAAYSSYRCAQVLRACGRRVERADGTRVWLVDTEYPVAAVTGVFRTRLMVSTRILAECTPGEVDAVLRHEQAHVRRRDNLVRAAILALPNPLSLMRTGREMAGDLSAAAEESADDAAAGQEAASRTAMASALVRVAKMARTPAPPWMPALAFYEGSNLEHRVRRLLDSSGLASRMGLCSMAMLASVALLVAAALTEPVAREVHAWMETAVHLVP